MEGATSNYEQKDIWWNGTTKRNTGKFNYAETI